MTTEQLRERHQSRPFQPFLINTADGRSFPVPHPEMLALSPNGRVAVVFGSDGVGRYIDLLLVASLEPVPDSPAPSAKTGG